MGMSALRATSSSPMMALRSTAAVDTITRDGAVAPYDPMPASISSLNWPGLQCPLSLAWGCKVMCPLSHFP